MLRRKPGTLQSPRGVALVTGFVLLVSLMAMQFADEVAWGVFDFVVAGALLGGAGLVYLLVASTAGNADGSPCQV